MAKRVTLASAKAAVKPKRLRIGPTFIQRSRSESSEQKALWHHVSGAGRSRVLRPFFDLNASDETALAESLETLIAARTGATKS
jgi:hypothetical protein